VDIITLDFETFYSKTFSLSKMTTEAYVRSDEFQVICVGVKRNDEPTTVYWGDLDHIHKKLGSYELHKCAVLCHNSAFDGFILSEHFDIRPKFWLDTLSMARPIHNVDVGCSLAALVRHYGLGEKGTEVVNAMGLRREDFNATEAGNYREYCALDVDLTWKLFHVLKKHYRQAELQVIDTTIRMFTEPHIEVNYDVLHYHLKDIREKKAALLDKLGGDRIGGILRSNPKFAKLLQALGVEPPMKTSPTTGKETFAFAKTDKAFIALQEHEDARVRAVVEARLGTKSSIEETRTEGLMQVAERGPLPIMLNYYGAHTGRFSGGDGLNLQNLPSRKGNTIRWSLEAPKGYMLAVSDSSQIEARVVAWLAEQNDLVEAFRQGRDVYCEFASEIYGRQITKDDKTERFVGKTCILGLGYGMGHVKFRDTLRAQGGVVIDEDEAQRIVQLYRAKYFKIPELWRKVDKAIRALATGGTGMINGKLRYTEQGFMLPNGMVIRYHGLQDTSDGMMYANTRKVARQLEHDADAIFQGTKIYGGKAVENIVQALARIVITDQMLDVKREHGYPVLFQVHDELIFLVLDMKKDEAEYHLRNILIAMARPPEWAPDIPVACEGSVARSYGEAK
jgi:DNA polymerase